MPHASNHRLSRLHPRTMMALVGASFLVGYADLLAWRGVPRLPWIGLLVLAGVAMMGGRALFGRWARRTLLLLLPFALSYLLMQGFFAPHGGQALFHLGPFPFAEAGFYEGLRYLSRIALPLAAVMLMGVVVPPVDAVTALEEIGLPHELGYVLLTAMTLLPTLQERATQIQQAQQARGLRTSGPLWVRIRSLLPLVGPLVSSALYDAEMRAIALETRGFRQPGPRTPWRLLHDSAIQRWWRRAVLLVALALFIVGRVGWGFR